jgi:hypothetical protein
LCGGWNKSIFCRKDVHYIRFRDQFTDFFLKHRTELHQRNFESSHESQPSSFPGLLVKNIGKKTFVANSLFHGRLAHLEVSLINGKQNVQNT